MENIAMFFEYLNECIHIMPMWYQIIVMFMIFVMGAFFGSFLTLATYRIPRKLDILVSRSFCPNCKHKLSFWDLFPILSYVFLGGKCRYCKEKISPRYFIFEICNGTVFLVLYLLLGINIKFIILITIYILIFLIIGSYCMNKKMIKENNINENKEINKKKGIFITELVIALIMFSVVMTTSYSVAKNAASKAEKTIANTCMVNFAMKNMELALATDYDALQSFTSYHVYNNITYTSNVNVKKYNEGFRFKEDYIKVINVKVTYTVDGETFNYELDAIKKKV